MRYIEEKIKVEEQNEARLKGFLLEKSSELVHSNKRPAILICPGGAYRFLSDRESEPIALKFLAEGMHAFVLEYSVAPNRYPTALLQLANAVATIKQNAKEWLVDSNHIYLCGFSAGGHLCASLGIKWNLNILKNKGNHHTSLDIKPAGMLLCYPVITMGDFTHTGSRNNLLGMKYTQNQVEENSLEQQITKDTVPSFIWHTVEDEAVSVENSLQFVCALQRQGIPYEAHFFEKGEHGIALASEVTEDKPSQVISDNQVWFKMALNWLKRRWMNEYK